MHEPCFAWLQTQSLICSSSLLIHFVHDLLQSHSFTYLLFLKNLNHLFIIIIFIIALNTMSLKRAPIFTSPASISIQGLII